MSTETKPTAAPQTASRPRPAAYNATDELPPREPRYRTGDVVAEHTVEAPTRHTLENEVITIDARYAGSLAFAGVGHDDGGPRLLVAVVREGKVIKGWPMPVQRSHSTSIYGDQLEVGDIIRVSMLRDLPDPIQVTIRPRTLS